LCHLVYSDKSIPEIADHPGKLLVPSHYRLYVDVTQLEKYLHDIVDSDHQVWELKINLQNKKLNV